MRIRPRSTRELAIVAAVVALAACAPPRFASPPGPYAYRQGWHEGCSDGYAVAGSPLYAQKISAAPGAVGAAYESGWQAGFNHCNASMGRIQRGIHVLFAPS
jgi:hypothetical protein